MNINESIAAATAEGKLSNTAAERLLGWIQSGLLPEWASKSLTEMVEQGAWEELNDRFYRDLNFGTGGMRGRCIGKVMAPTERGGFPELQTTPDHPAVGTHCFNDFNVARATLGLYRYVKSQQGETAAPCKLKLVVAYDVRHFSQHFGELTASVWTQSGGQALIFSGPRATPELSFAVRHLNAAAGVVISASHNPPHDNGYKVYMQDGAQATQTNAKGIMQEATQVSLKELTCFWENRLGRFDLLPEAVDKAYLETLEQNVLDYTRLRAARLRMVFTPLHGTGQVCALPLLKRCGVEVITVPEQMTADARFPTVTLPNPEDPAAFERAIAVAKRSEADMVIATDPDADRMGAAARNSSGNFEVLSGNVLGAAMAEHRVTLLKEQGLLPPQGSQRAALITTFVTTPLMGAIAAQHGLKHIQTLTGFKWIGAKLNAYEAELRSHLLKDRKTSDWDYDGMEADQRRRLLLKHSTYCVLAAEESYGYLVSDRARDKDAHAALSVFCELMGSLKQQGLTFNDYLDELYRKYGYFYEHTAHIYYEGAQGATKITRILDSYRNEPPKNIGTWPVTKSADFGHNRLYDADGDRIPAENFYRFELENGYSFAVRGSGTEPKIKYYLFGRETIGTDGLEMAKKMAKNHVSALAKAVIDDAYARV